MTANSPWQGRVAVVTGASRGLGAGLAATFAAEGLSLGLCARGLPAAAGEACLTAAVDVTDGAAIERFAEAVVERFGGIDLWVNNAGLLEPIGPLADIDGEAVARLVRVNVDGVINGSRAFLRQLRRRRAADRAARGVLVNLSSGAARNAYAGWSAYCASKAAVDRFTECLQLEEGERGLRAFALAPGVVDTDMQAAIRATPAERFPAVQKFLELKQEEAFNSPAHVARHVLRLAFAPQPGDDDAVAASTPQESGSPPVARASAWPGGPPSAPWTEGN